LAEQLTLNQLVEGSSPSGVTETYRQHVAVGFFVEFGAPFGRYQSVSASEIAKWIARNGSLDKG
jgi:hypothetical protein